jgi:CubicO group peptidase (beta-lactamase class C family)
VGWAVYNVLETENGHPGYVCKASSMAQTMADRGLGDYIPTTEVTQWLPGDILSMKGHVWIAVGMCSDGSVLLLHASPPGVIFSGTLLPDGSESDATIRALMCHTAGIVDGEDAFYGLRRSDPEITLLDILEGRTSYNNRPARAEKPQGAAFEYSDAGYCVLQLLVQEVTGKPLDDAARMLVFDELELKNTFFASRKNVEYYEANVTMATGYDGEGLPLPGKYPYQPDLAASALWSTPKELLAIAKAFIEAYHGRSTFLQEASAREMAKPVEKFPWTGLGMFPQGEDVIMSQGWGENGQCMLKMNTRTGAVSAVMTNRNPEVDQTASGVEWLVNRNMV